MNKIDNQPVVKDQPKTIPRLKNFVVIILFVLIAIVLAMVFVFFQIGQDVRQNSDDNAMRNITQDSARGMQQSYSNIVDDQELLATEAGFELRGVYNPEQSSWEYDLSGTIPNPCYRTELEVTIQESLPETVIVRLDIEASDDEICIQVVEEFRHSGIVEVSENAKFELIVNI